MSKYNGQRSEDASTIQQLYACSKAGDTPE